MLKIKDEVDLKELEKFGFVKDYYVDTEVYIKRFKLGTSYFEEIIIWKCDRQVQIVNGIRLLKTIYDLIQAGLVEKI